MTDEIKSEVDLAVPANFIDDEAVPGVAYIQPNIEINLTDEKRQQCREIVKEIKKFGVSQRQMLFLIDLMALELESLDLLREIRRAVKEQREKMNQGQISGGDSESSGTGLILPG